jgi:hypothetical protein
MENNQYEAFDLADISKPENVETTGQRLLRGGARSASRVAEAALGLPGDIASGALGLTNMGIEKLTGSPSPLPAEQNIWPTSQNLKDVTRDVIEKPLLPEGYLQPQGETEKFSDMVLSDLTQLAIPLKGKLPLGRVLAGSGLTSLAGNLASEASKALGDIKIPYANINIPAGEKRDAVIKGATMLLSSLAGPTGLRALKDHNYNLADQALAETDLIKVTPKLEQTVDALSGLKKRGLLSKDIEKGFEPFLKDLKSGDIKAKELWNFAVNLGEWTHGTTSSGNLTRVAKAQLTEATKALKTSLTDWAKTNNKDFYKAINIADPLNRSINATIPVIDTMSKHLNPKNLTPASAFLLGAQNLIGTAGLLKGAGAAIATREGARALNALAHSPEARRLYGSVVSAASAKDIAKMNKSAERLGKVISNSSVPEMPETKDSDMFEAFQLP